MQAASVRESALEGFIQATGRATLLSAFMLETWSRLHMLRAGDAPTRAQEFRWVSENMCALHGLRPSLRGPNHIPSGPSVLVANHLTYFDPLVLGSLLPLAAVAKREVRDWPVVGALSQKLGTLYVTREDAHSGARCLREARRILEAGVSVLVFPEGTTTRGDSVLPFKRGIFGLAAQVRVPVVPVCLRYERAEAAWVGDDAFLPHYLKNMRQRCTRIELEFLEPLWVASTRDAEDAAVRARMRIVDALRRPPGFVCAERELAQRAVSLASA